jgi:hypothetical protein
MRPLPSQSLPEQTQAVAPANGGLMLVCWVASSFGLDTLSFTSNARHCLFPQTSRASHVCKFLGGVVVPSPIAVADMAAKHLLLATLACQFLYGHAGFIFSPPHAQLSGKDDSSFIRKGHSMAEELLKVLESIAAGILQLKSKFCVTGIAWKW